MLRRAVWSAERTFQGALGSLHRCCCPAGDIASEIQKLAEKSKRNGGMIDCEKCGFGELKCLNNRVSMSYNAQRLRTSSLKNGKCWLLRLEETV